MPLTFSNDANGHVPLYYIAVTISSPSSSSNFQQRISMNSNTNSSYYNSALSNVNWQDGAGNIINSHLESGEINTSTASIYNLKIPTGSTSTVYQVLYGTSQNSMDGVHTGAEPKYTGTYGQYDNGTNIFNLYDNFVGSSLNTSIWSVLYGSYAISNGCSLSDGGIITKASYNPQSYLAESDIYTTASTQVETLVWFSGTYYMPAVGYGNSGSYYSIRNLPSGSFVNIAAGSTSTYQVISIWESASTSYGMLNYANTVSNSDHFVAQTSNQCFIGSDYGPTYAQWFRIRLLPPSGTMPSTSQGSLTQITTSASVAGSGAISASGSTISNSKWAATGGLSGLAAVSFPNQAVKGYGVLRGTASITASSKSSTSGGIRAFATFTFPSQVILSSGSVQGLASYVASSMSTTSGAVEGRANYTASSAISARGMASASAKVVASSFVLATASIGASATVSMRYLASGSGVLSSRAAYIASSAITAAGLIKAKATVVASSVVAGHAMISATAVSAAHQYVISLNGLSGALTLIPGPNITISTNGFNTITIGATVQSPAYGYAANTYT
jgi:hypothetical protein